MMLHEIGKDLEDLWLNLHRFSCTEQLIVVGMQFVETKDTNHGENLLNSIITRALPSSSLWEGKSYSNGNHRGDKTDKDCTIHLLSLTTSRLSAQR